MQSDSPTQRGQKRPRAERQDEQRQFLSNAELAAVVAEAEVNVETKMQEEEDDANEQPQQKRLRRLHRLQEIAEEEQVQEVVVEEITTNVEEGAVDGEQAELNAELENLAEPVEQASNLTEDGEEQQQQQQEEETGETKDQGSWGEEFMGFEDAPEEQPETKAPAAGSDEDDGVHSVYPGQGSEEKKRGGGRRGRRDSDRRGDEHFAAAGDANRSAAAQQDGGGGGALASMLAALAGAGGASFLDPVRPAPLMSVDSKENDAEEKESEDRYREYEQKLRETQELQDDNDTIQKDLAALETVGHGTLAAHLMNRRHFDLNIGWKPHTWCFMCECGQNRQMWEKNRYYGMMIKIIEDGLATMDPNVLCRKVQMHYNKELRWTLRRKELRDLAWSKNMIWKHITVHAPTTRSMLEVERINISRIMDVLADSCIQMLDPATNRRSIDPGSTKLYLALQVKRDKIVQQLVLLRSNDTF